MKIKNNKWLIKQRRYCFIIRVDLVASRVNFSANIFIKQQYGLFAFGNRKIFSTTSTASIDAPVVCSGNCIQLAISCLFVFALLRHQTARDLFAGCLRIQISVVAFLRGKLSLISAQYCVNIIFICINENSPEFLKNYGNVFDILKLTYIIIIT